MNGNAAGKIVSIELSDSNQAGKKKASPHTPKVSVHGDQVKWHNKTKQGAIGLDLDLDFETQDNWPFVGKYRLIRVPADSSSTEYAVNPDGDLIGYTYRVLDLEGNPLQETTGGPGDPGVLLDG